MSLSLKKQTLQPQHCVFVNRKITTATKEKTEHTHASIVLLTERLLQRPDQSRQLKQTRSHPVFAAGIFEGAEDKRAAAVVLHVVSQVLPGDVGCAALVRALDREAGAVVLVVLWKNSVSDQDTGGTEGSTCP